MSNPAKSNTGSVAKKQKDGDGPALPSQGSSKQLVPSAPSASASSGNVKVVCRVRPTNKKEEEMGGKIAVEFVDDQTIALKITQQNPDAGLPDKQKFAFDRVFKMNTRQEEIYEFAAKPVVNSVLEGFNGTVFAYGQTSSGKTHTMQGPSIDDPELRGIIPRMVNTVFDHISQTPEHIEFTVKISIVEIYLERIRDLLSPEKSNLKVREDKARGIYIEDVTESYVSDESEVYNIMKLGASNRAISATNMNEGSSRSHSVFMMTIHQNNLHELSAKTGKLYLVDLAGSEKISKTGAAGQTLEEAKMINKSLSALGNVINALTESKSGLHIPYRDSKLTRLLQESLGGNARTTLIITCSPNPFNEQETLSTLRFGYRAKSIKNTPKINKEFTVAELKLLLDKAEANLALKERRIKYLENMLAKRDIAVPTEAEVAGEVAGEITETKEVPETPASTKPTEDSESDSEENKNDSDFSNQQILSNLQIISNNDDLARIKILECELEAERKNVRTQTEKVNILRKEFSLLNSKLYQAELINEQLVRNLASVTMTEQELEEGEKEIEQGEGHSAENGQIAANVEDVANKMVKDMAVKFGISNEEELKTFALSYLREVQNTGAKENQIIAEGEAGVEKTNEELKVELIGEKEKNAKLQNDLQKLKQDYESVRRKALQAKGEKEEDRSGDGQTDLKTPSKKSQRVQTLEKQIGETKDLVNQYKNKIDLLKSLVAASNSTNSMSQILPSNKEVDSYIQRKEYIKQRLAESIQKDNVDDILRKSIGGSSLKIVKHIRGGTKGSIDASGNKQFLNVLKKTPVSNSISIQPTLFTQSEDKGRMSSLGQQDFAHLTQSSYK